MHSMWRLDRSTSLTLLGRRKIKLSRVDGDVGWRCLVIDYHVSYDSVRGDCHELVGVARDRTTLVYSTPCMLVLIAARGYSHTKYTF
jgi:hypothetical protein